MVGIVIVSHSKNLAESIAEFTTLMADGANVAAAGGTDDGGFGTSFQKIYDAIDSVYSDDGVILLMDMGSAVMTAEMVLEMYGSDKVVMADCPVVEGAVVATVNAQAGMSREEILEALKDVGKTPKF
ncbi:MAG: dihydroxyacetone kinase phosphoryl donor subunit DhaM [Lachnospiraceae bacterium]